MKRIEDADFIEAAERLYEGHGGQFTDGDINIDADAEVSVSDDGAYVRAWVWVPLRDVQGGDNA